MKRRNIFKYVHDSDAPQPCDPRVLDPQVRHSRAWLGVTCPKCIEFRQKRARKAAR